ncbi:MAG: hypothetical protein IJ088_10735, partial [Clostridia bacterium]|nr:hypothetical protein [Clostridia bacterium]
MSLTSSQAFSYISASSLERYDLFFNIIPFMSLMWLQRQGRRSTSACSEAGMKGKMEAFVKSDSQLLNKCALLKERNT